MLSFLSSLIGPGLKAFGNARQSNAASSGLDVLGRNEQELADSQADLQGELEAALGISLGELQGQSLGANLGNIEDILGLGGHFSDFFGEQSLKHGEKGYDFLLDKSLSAADAGSRFIDSAASRSSNSIGIPLQELSKNIQGGAYEELGRANSLIDGSYYSTDVGQQATENLFRNLAPYLSETGLNATSGRTFGGSASLGENQGITAFLRNAEQGAQYGDNLKSTALSRLGGVLTTGLQFGTNSANSGLQFGQNTANQALNFGQNAAQAGVTAAGSQLVTPNQAIHLNDNKIATALDLIGLNQQAGQGISQARSQLLGMSPSPISGTGLTQQLGGLIGNSGGGGGGGGGLLGGLFGGGKSGGGGKGLFS